MVFIQAAKESEYDDYDYDEGNNGNSNNKWWGIGAGIVAVIGAIVGGLWYFCAGFIFRPNHLVVSGQQGQQV